MADRVYDAVRGIVERLGGTMRYEREGHRIGAWIIKVGEHYRTFQAGGERSFPELDRLYVPNVPDPRTWDDYTKELVPDAESKLLTLLREPAGEALLPDSEAERLAQIVGRAKWKFSWTLARIYPHEYTRKSLCPEEDHAWLIDAIEKYGVTERFGKNLRKYLYFQERKYWHMGDPESEDPEERPNVINRVWVDVRRHAENVRHRWTPEEVELQMRLWEIQLEKSTDRPTPPQEERG